MATDPTSSASRDGEKPLPPELTPKRGPGRPPGSKTRVVREASELSPRAVASAWVGLWLVARFVTWLLAGRRGAPLAVATGASWTLVPLTAAEADADAKELLPLVRELPGPVLFVCTWIGLPVLLARRVSEKLTRKPPVAVPAANAGPEQPKAA